jgi:hypothetical protein
MPFQSIAVGGDFAHEAKPASAATKTVVAVRAQACIRDPRETWWRKRTPE